MTTTRNSRPIPILMYHQCATPPAKGTPFRSLTVDPAVFARHMRWLKAMGYRGLSMRDLQPYLRGEKQGKVFGLTFDDGFVNVAENAVPIMADLGFTATNYFVAAQVGGTNAWDAEKGVPTARLMDGGQIRAWANAGHEVGSHTIAHANLKECSADQAREQIGGSRKMLQDVSGESVDAFCYPYGYYLPEQCALVAESGYTNATTTRRGRVQPGQDMMELSRVHVLRSTHFASMMIKLFTPREELRGR